MPVIAAALWALAMPLEPRAQPYRGMQLQGGLPGGTSYNSRAMPFNGIRPPRLEGNPAGGTPSLVIDQVRPRATIDWDRFNVDAGETVDFRGQPSDSILNRIHQQDPSIIRGSIKGQQQVILYNQNGVVFADGARVNVRNLVASTLAMRDASFTDGITTGDTPETVFFDFTAVPGAPGGRIEVEPGAVLQAPEGGSITLLGATVAQGGTIETPGGQALLAAGQRVFLGVTQDRTLPGLVVGVGGGASGEVTNTGTISAPRGNVTIASLLVNQAGRVSATTSVRQQGSIILKAEDSISTARNTNAEPAAQRFGTLTLGGGSITEVQPEGADPTTTLDAETFRASAIELKGRHVTLEPASLVQAPGGSVAIEAQPSAGNPEPARVYIAPGSRIDVAGTTTTLLPMARNQLKVRLTSNELANFPLQRQLLRNQTVSIDVRAGASVADVTGYQAGVGRTVVERLAPGGSIDLAVLGGDLVLREGASLDLSGGFVTYEAGTLTETRLMAIGHNRQYRISEAPPLANYKPAEPLTWFEPGYRQGNAAGALNVAVQRGGLVLDGTIEARIFPGPRQRLTTAERAEDRPPTGLRLRLDVERDVVFAVASPPLPGDFQPSTLLPDDDAATIRLDPDLVQGGPLGSLTVTTPGGGDITVEPGVTLTTQPGGSIELSADAAYPDQEQRYVTIDEKNPAGDVRIAGALIAPGGTITLSGRTVELAAGGTLDASGTWVNDAVDAAGRRLGEGEASPAPPLAIDGGVIRVYGLEEVALQPGAAVDVSGGGRLERGGLTPGRAAVEGGAGGTLEIATNRLVPRLTNNDKRLEPGAERLILGATLAGYGLATSSDPAAGGRLAIATGRITFGGDATAGGLPVDLAALAATGFESVSLQSYLGVSVPAGAELRQFSVQRLVRPGLDQLPTGGKVALFTETAIATAGRRRAPGLRLDARGPFSDADATSELDELADIEIGTASRISGETAALIELVAGGSIRVDGTVEVAGGHIRLIGSAGRAPGQTVELLPNAVLRATGSFRPGELLWDPAGRSLGVLAAELLPGAVTVLGGYTVLRAGSLIDVGGVMVETAVRSFPGLGQRRLPIDGGRIELLGREGLFVAGTLRGRGGGPGAADGRITTRVDAVPIDVGAPVDRPRVLRLAQTAAGFIGPIWDGQVSSLADFLGQGFVTVEAIQGEFDDWIIAGGEGVRFEGEVAIGLDAAIYVLTPVLGGLVAADMAAPPQTVALRAPYVAFDGETLAADNALAAATARPGDAAPTLRVDAQLIDFKSNVRIGGTDGRLQLDTFAEAQFASSGDIRFVTSSISDRRLSSPGDLVFTAGQLYPTTGGMATDGALRSFRVEATAQGSRVEVRPAAVTPPAPPLSAGGRLVLAADIIRQDGVVRAPFGQLELDAGRELALGAGSITSVSGKGVLVPYGRIENGAVWYNPFNVRIDSPPQKTVRLAGDAISVEAGALVDLAGGGDLFAAEFVPAIDGTRDLVGEAASVAILPGYTGYAPYDPAISGERINIPDPATGGALDVDPLAQGSATNLRVGQAIELAAGPGIAAGAYTVLPAEYALLPGAVLGSPQPDYDGVPATLARRTAEGAFIRTGTSTTLSGQARAPLALGIELAEANVIDARARYDRGTADAFFQSEAFLEQQLRDQRPEIAPRLPRDSGGLTLAADTGLTLTGRADFSAGPGGTLGRLDIGGARIAILGAGIEGGDLAGYLILDPVALGSFGAGSVLIGGTRRDVTDGTGLTVEAGSVIVRNDAATALALPELILAARDIVQVEPGSVITTTGAAQPAGLDLILDGSGTAADGALLRASSGPPVAIERDTPVGRSGTLILGANAQLAIPGSLTLDSTAATLLETDRFSAGLGLTATASRISFGNVAADGLVFRGAALTTLAGSQQLDLRSRSSIDFYGDITLDLGQGSAGSRLALDAPNLIVHDGGMVRLAAGSFELSNSSLAGVAALAVGSGSLALESRSGLALGEGAVGVGGVAGLSLRARERVATTGEGSLGTSGNLRITAPAISAGAGVEYRLSAAGAVQLGRTDATEVPVSPALGGQLAIDGDTVAVDTRIEAQAGAIDIAARNLAGQADAIALGGQAVLDVSGTAKAFFDEVAFLPGGTIRLEAGRGNVTLGAGSRLQLQGAAAGGDAGSLTVVAPGGSLVREADSLVAAQAGAGHRGGSLALDLGSLRSFDGLASDVAAAGFTDALALRLRNGDIAMGTGTLVRGRTIELAADRGRIDVAGQIDARGPSGGAIGLWAGTGLSLQGTARLDASGLGPDSAGRGGSVKLGTQTGLIDLVPGARIDVGAGGAAIGELTLRTPRTAEGQVAFGGRGAAVEGAARVTVEAVRVTELPAIGGTATIDAGTIAQVSADVAAFTAQVSSLEADFSSSFGRPVGLQPGVELRAAGNLVLSTNWDFAPAAQPGQRPEIGRPASQPAGVLTLRATGDLGLNGNLGDGFRGSTLFDGATWSYRLVAGADLAGAEPTALIAPLALPPAQGSVRLAAGRAVRTGAGDVEVAAARDVVIGPPGDRLVGNINALAAIYTAGVPTPVDPALRDFEISPGLPPLTSAVFPTGGGDVSIRAQGSLQGSPAAQLPTDYVWRQGGPSGFLIGQPAWWINFATFRQGVGALGGGHVELKAGGDIVNLGAVLPTTGYVVGDIDDPDGTPVTTIRGGGDLEIRAGDDVFSGLFYVGRGAGRITAGGEFAAGVAAPFVNVEPPQAPGDPTVGPVNTPSPIYPVLLAGDATMEVRTGGDLRLEGIVDPTFVARSGRQNSVTSSSTSIAGAFSTRTERTAASMTTIGGELELRNEPGRIASISGIGTTNAAIGANFSFIPAYRDGFAANNFRPLRILPANLRLVAASGDLSLGSSTLGPGPDAAVAILAEGDISLGSLVLADPAGTATILTPADPNSLARLAPLLPQPIGAALAPNTDSRYADDPTPVRIYSTSGDVAGRTFVDRNGVLQNRTYLSLTKPARIAAGGDIRDFAFFGTHNRKSDLTAFTAGDDIVLGALDDIAIADGQTAIDPSRIGTTSGLVQSGPGQLLLEAAGDVDLGFSGGVLSIGNLAAPDLEPGGASITVVAGLGPEGRDLEHFLQLYLDPATFAAGSATDYLVAASAGTPQSIYAPELIAFMAERTGRTDYDYATAWQEFTALEPTAQLPLANEIFFAELVGSGREAGSATGPRAGGTVRGYAAVEALFPGTSQASAPQRGAVLMRDTQVRTLRGGDVAVVVPRGSIETGAVSLGSLAESLRKSPDEAGIWTALSGDIDLYAYDDVLIRASRVIAAGPGDVAIWSSYGDIDAGLGSRTAISAAPLRIRIGPTGLVAFEPGGITSGSGIATLGGGNTDLFAPNGIIDAGEAGIRSTGNLNLVARVVVNAENIEVGGVAVGVPQATASSASLAGPANAAAAAREAVEQAVEEQTRQQAERAAEGTPLAITGAFLGAG